MFDLRGKREESEAPAGDIMGSGLVWDLHCLITYINICSYILHMNVSYEALTFFTEQSTSEPLLLKPGTKKSHTNRKFVSLREVIGQTSSIL